MKSWVHFPVRWVLIIYYRKNCFKNRSKSEKNLKAWDELLGETRLGGTCSKRKFLIPMEDAQVDGALYSEWKQLWPKRWPSGATHHDSPGHLSSLPTKIQDLESGSLIPFKGTGNIQKPVPHSENSVHGHTHTTYINMHNLLGSISSCKSTLWTRFFPDT